MDQDLREIAARLRADQVNSGNYDQREVCLREFTNAWKPLADHAQDLADRYFPAGCRLRIEFKVDEKMNLDMAMNIELDLDPGESTALYRENPDLRWKNLAHMSFYRRDYSEGSIKRAEQRQWPKPLARRLRDLFPGAPPPADYRFALQILDLQAKDPRLADAVLIPSRMDDARGLVTYWLAKNLAFEFDNEAMHPVSVHQITIKRQDSTQKPAP